jgi:hypothetical protein
VQDRRHGGIGPLLLVAGVVLIGVALVSRRWLHAEHADAFHTGLLSSGTGGKLTLLALVATAVLALTTLIFRRRFVTMLTALTALFTVGYASLHVFTWRADGIAGGAYSLALLALTLVLVATGLLPVTPQVSADEVGELVDGKREGRWLIYEDGKVIEMRDYKAGVVEKTIPYGPKPPAAS